jgi:hypothetical protein
MIALYKFRFHELDQSIDVGEEGEFTFFVDPHYRAAPTAPIRKDMILVFANTFGPEGLVSHSCRIVAIDHPQLGSVRSISTRGLEYTVTLTNGTAFRVEAEERPGSIQEGPVVADWTFLVNIEPLF